MNITETLEGIGKEIVQNYTNSLKVGDKNVTNELTNSIQYEVKDLGDGNYQLLFGGIGYWVVVEGGRKPGKWVPVQPLKEWVINRGLAKGDSEINSLTYLINRKIKEEGIRPTNYLLNILNENVERYADIIAKQMGDDILSFIDVITERELKSSLTSKKQDLSIEYKVDKWLNSL